MCKLLSNAHEKLSKHGVISTNTPFDHVNTVEVACLLALRLVSVPEDGFSQSMEQRLLLCACLTIAIKNPLDGFAFSRLYHTQHAKTPLVVVYQCLFEHIVNFDEHEKDSTWLQQKIELLEGWVLAESKFDIFKTLNESPTSCFQIEAYDVLRAANEDHQAYERGLLAQRNVASFYVFMALGGFDDDVRRKVACHSENSFVGAALRCLALISIAVCNENGTGGFLMAASLVKWASRCSHEALEFARRLVCVAIEHRDRAFERRCKFATEAEFGVLVGYKTMKLVQMEIGRGGKN